MTKEEAEEKLALLVEAKVDAVVTPIKAELAQSRRERVQWFFAGYDAGLADDPKQKDVGGRVLTLEQRRTKAAAAYSLTSNKKVP